MSEHVLKVVAPYFDALLDGSKTFEVRKNDRGFQRGDVLTLWEFDPSPGACSRFPCAPCSPRFVRREVTFVYSGDPRFGRDGGLETGFVVLGLADRPATEDGTR